MCPKHWLKGQEGYKEHVSSPLLWNILYLYGKHTTDGKRVSSTGEAVEAEASVMGCNKALHKDRKGSGHNPQMPLHAGMKQYGPVTYITKY